MSPQIDDDSTKMESNKLFKYEKCCETEIAELNIRIQQQDERIGRLMLSIPIFYVFTILIMSAFFVNCCRLLTTPEEVRTRLRNATLSDMFKDFPSEVKTFIDELKATNQNLTEELNLEKMKTKYIEEDILTGIVGSWRMVDSVGMEDFVKKMEDKTNVKQTDPIWSVVFQGGVQNFEVDKESQRMNMFMTVGNQKFEEFESVLGMNTDHSRNFFYAFTTFVERHGAQLSTVSVSNYSVNEEYLRTERYIRDGKLYVVDKRFGMSCTRIYKKIDESKYHFV